MDRVFEIASQVSTPLALAGLLAAAFFLVARQVIARDLFPTLSRQFSVGLLRLIIDRLFVLSLVAIVLGFSGFALTALLNRPPSSADANQGQSGAELVELLHLRAEAVKDQIDELIRRIERDPAAVGVPNCDRKQFETTLRDLSRQFSTLHNNHLAALHAGQQVLAHEANRRIQDLLAGWKQRLPAGCGDVVTVMMLMPLYRIAPPTQQGAAADAER